jgi:hypothetical protein
VAVLLQATRTVPIVFVDLPDPVGVQPLGGRVMASACPSMVYNGSHSHSSATATVKSIRPSLGTMVPSPIASRNQISTNRLS